MKRLVSAHIPTQFGPFVILAFGKSEESNPHLAFVHESLWSSGDSSIPEGFTVPVRIHSECMTGDVFGSKRCECGPQLNHALQLLGSDTTPGILLYLRQEGRGIGLVNKLRAYNVQDKEGLDTFEANRVLGHADDERNYSDAVSILQELRIDAVRLLTNNPEKMSALEEGGIDVIERIPIVIPSTIENAAYLEAKRKSGHWLDENV